MQYLYLCPVCLAAVVAFIVLEHREKYVPAVIMKGLASAVFVLAGILGSRLCADSVFAKRVVVGLVLGCIADVLLNLRFVFDKAGQKVFLVGILVFLAGHVLYLAALMPGCGCLVLSLAAGVVLTAVTMFFILRAVTAKPAFKIFGVFYIGAVTLMTCVAVGSLISQPSARTAVFSAGAVCFLVSDIVLILNTFTGKTRFGLRITNLGLYYIGQLLIAFSLQLP